jgi:endonuclease/exonuclease/phosphatase family metal-dependent hydrolase
VSSSSFTVSTKAATNAKRYRLFASTNKSDLYVSNINAAHRSGLSRKPLVSLHGLQYTASPYYYRVEALNGPYHRFSAVIGSVGLRPATPERVTANTSSNGLSLSWASAPAAGYEIQQSTSPSWADAKDYTITGGETQFTPYGLQDGATYYFRVRALNGTTPSAYAAPITATASGSQQQVKVMTYNVLEAFGDGRAEGDGHVAPWSKRLPKVIKLIHQGNPDVIAIQEAAAWVGKVRGPTQIDSIVSHLGGEYALAHTEIPVGQKGWIRTGVYILYKKSEYRPVGQGDHWALGNQRWAAHQVLENVQTGARFLMVAPHLEVGDGRKFDNMRKAETKSLLSQAQAFVANDPMPVVYAGDFNSDPDKRHAYNAPSMVMSAAHIDDAFDVAQSHHNARYNSANGYYRRPPVTGYRIDYIYAPPGVAVKSWRLIIDLKHGRFVGVIPSDHNPVMATLEIPY